MYLSKWYYALGLVATMLWSGCSQRDKKAVSTDKITSEERYKMVAYVPRPNPRIFKLKGAYQGLVPVTLSEDKTSIVGYPAPSDCRVLDMVRYPMEVGGGYWLDNIGVGLSTGYLNMNLEEYSQLKSPMTMVQMQEQMLDVDPYLEMYECSTCSMEENIVDKVKGWVEEGKLEANTTKLK